jgi:nicotinate-nucleotide pyrophosphorylase (carboxylating)
MNSKELPWNEIDPLIERALAEDIGNGDLTTEYLIPEDSFIEAEWVANEPCCLAGLPIVDRIFQK